MEPPTKSATLLRLDRVHKTFRRGGTSKTVLDGVSLALGHGQLSVLRGENGVGKTTLLRIAAGILTPDAGAVFAGGDPVPLAQGAIALAAGDDHRFNTRLTVEDHLRAQSYAYGVPWRLCRDRAISLIARLDIDGGLMLRLSHASAGTRGKISLMRALIVRPRVLLLDEPTATLSPRGASAVGDVLEELLGESTVLVATHRQDFAACVDANVRELALCGGKLSEKIPC